MRHRVLGVVLPFACALACHAGPDVARLQDGRSIDGRFISPEAYARFLDGAILEAQGDETHAADTYDAALKEDPNAPGILARLGVVLCVANPAGADSALTLAQRLAPDLGDVWSAAAECALKRGNGENAVTAALHAAAVSPDDAATSLLVVQAFDSAGDPRTASRWLRALSLRHDRFIGHTTKPLSADEALEEAPVDGDGTTIRSAQDSSGADGADLALRALMVGRTDLGSETADRVLAAEPGNVDARIAALVAADLAGREDRFSTTARRLPADRTAVGPLGARMMESLLRRRSGDLAARAWAAAWLGEQGRPAGRSAESNQAIPGVRARLPSGS